MKAVVHKNDDFCNCGSNNWETVVDRRVHAARLFASMAMSFCTCKSVKKSQKQKKLAKLKNV